MSAPVSSEVPPPPAGPAWGYAPPPEPQSQPHGMALAALIIAVGSFLLPVLGVIGFPVALVLGYVARRDIRATAGTERSEGLATAAIATAWIGVVLFVLAALFLVLAVVFLAAGP